MAGILPSLGFSVTHFTLKLHSSLLACSMRRLDWRLYVTKWLFIYSMEVGGKRGMPQSLTRMEEGLAAR
jgi:hypothetical protein